MSKIKLPPYVVPYEKRKKFHRKVRAGFLKIAKENNKRCHIINADQSKNDINEKIIQIINKKFRTKFE